MRKLIRESLQHSECTGCPLGNETFIVQIEAVAVLGRLLRLWAAGGKSFD
jgi:hypothetical protein